MKKRIAGTTPEMPKWLINEKDVAENKGNVANELVPNDECVSNNTTAQSRRARSRADGNMATIFLIVCGSRRTAFVRLSIPPCFGGENQRFDSARGVRTAGRPLPPEIH
jgi:hypothetical protein